MRSDERNKTLESHWAGERVTVGRHFLRDLVSRVGHLAPGPTIDVDLGADLQRGLGGHYPARFRGALARKSSRKCLMAL